MVDKYGADALRFTLIMGNSPGNDMRFSEEEITAYRNFANKIWNAARFTMNYLTIDKIELPRELETEDEWILNQYNDTVKSVRENLDKCELGVAAQKLYDFIWDKVCDWYIEFVKPRLFETNTDEKTRLSAQQTLCYVMSNTLALLHPFMPFVTEEIWQSLPHDGEALIIEKYPQYREELRFAESSEAMENVMALITQIRQVRNSMNVPSSKKTKLFIESDNSEVYISCSEFLKRLAGASEILFDSPGEVKTVPVVTADAKAFIPMDELVDIEKEKARLIKEMDRLKGEIARIESKLSNDGFVSKAPQKVVDAERTKKETYEKQLANVKKVFAEL